MPTRRRAPVALVTIVTLVACGALTVLGASFALGSAAGAEPATVTAADDGSGSSLSISQAIVLGAVEGLTEYLPVSSTGHLLVAERLMGIGTGEDQQAADTYVVVIQLGAILAVLGIYRKRFVSMIDGVRGRSADGRSTLVALMVAFMPAAIIGFAFGDTIKEHLLEPWAVAIAWFVGGVAIFVFVALGDRLHTRTTSIGAITWQQAGLIGAFQVIAMWPGTSRSLITILTALVIGISLPVAVEFSFLLGFVTLSAATFYDFSKNGADMIDQFGILSPVIGIIVAGIAAFVSVRWMVTYLEGHSLAIFGWYRIAAGVAVIVLLATDVI